MKKYILSIFIGVTCFLSQAVSQKSMVKNAVDQAFKEGKVFAPVEILSHDINYKAHDDSQNSIQNDDSESSIKNAIFYDFKLLEARKILNKGLSNLSITFKGNGAKSATLLLVEVPDNFYKYEIRTSAGDHYRGNRRQGMHYRGIVQGSVNSLAVISIYPNRISGIITTEEDGTFNLGKLEGAEKHTLYSAEELPLFDISEPGIDSLQQFQQKQSAPSALFADTTEQCEKCVSVYLEAGYSNYYENGSVQVVVDKILGIWNVVSTLYENDSMCVRLSELFVWTVPDPYELGIIERLSDYISKRRNFNGDVAILIDEATRGGIGLATYDQLCGFAPHGWVLIHDSYNQFPTYSWSVDVIAHELGHVIGARHTHNCSWNGDCTAIDGCVPTESQPANGCPESCPRPPSQSDGGTIMSYCNSFYGKNYLEGFHPQVADTLRAHIARAQCLGCYFDCSGDPPLAIVSPSVEIYNENDVTDEINTLVESGFEFGVKVSPHPVTAISRIELTVPEDDYVSMVIYDLNGRQILRPIDNTFYSTGKHIIEIKASDFLVNGFYIIRTSNSSRRLSKPLLVLE